MRRPEKRKKYLDALELSDSRGALHIKPCYILFFDFFDINIYEPISGLLLALILTELCHINLRLMHISMAMSPIRPKLKTMEEESKRRKILPLQNLPSATAVVPRTMQSLGLWVNQKDPKGKSEAVSANNRTSEKIAGIHQSINLDAIQC